MSNRPCITIDAQLLAAPSLDCGEEAALDYIDTLLDWSSLLDEPWVAIHMSERRSEALLWDGLYPIREKLKEVFDKYEVREYSPNDVARVVERLLAVTPSFETFYRVKDILWECVETDPDIIRLTTSPGLQSDLARCVTLLAVLRKHCAQPLGGHSIILRNAVQRIVSVRARIEYLDHSRDDIPDLPIPPEYFEGDVLTCDNFRGLIQCIDESVILVGASDDFGIELAIRIAMYKERIERGEDPDWNEIQVPSIGRKFRELCQRCCQDQAESLPPRILRSICEVLNDERLADVHALRSGSGGNAPQRLRGNDKAQRRDIDREFHLHYWEREDKAVEIASVVYHNDFSIPE